MRKVKVGILTAGRANLMLKYLGIADNVQLVAICDSDKSAMEKVCEAAGDNTIGLYTDFDEFLNHDMDAVILSEHSLDHARLTIKALKAGKHVYCEPMAIETVAEAVELIETVEWTGKIFTFAETHCFMPAWREMYKLCKEGKLGEFLYGEGEYIHNVEMYWPDLTMGNPDAWRNKIYATYYCAHSFGIFVRATGLRPVKVSGFELPCNAQTLRCGMKSGGAGILMITMENGAVVKAATSLGLTRTSIWTTMYGSRGRIESARDDAKAGDVFKIYVSLDEYDGENADGRVVAYEPKDQYSAKAETYSHAGSDFYSVWNFAEKVLGNHEADVIDVYQGMDMCLPGIFGYESVMNGNASVDIPDLRDPVVRDKYRNHTACTDPKKAGDQWVPSFSKGDPVIPAEVYARQKSLCNGSGAMEIVPGKEDE